MSINTYLYVDGFEYDLWPTFDGCNPDIGAVGLAANDNIFSRTLDVSQDFIREGFTAYGSTEMKDDEFSSSGFTSWDSYGPGIQITLVEGAGIAHLSGTGDFTGGPGITDLDVAVPWADYYFLTSAKVPVHSYPTIISGGYTRFSGGVDVVIAYYSNGIHMTATGVVGGVGTADEHFIEAVMDDGNWHSVGFRRHLSPTCGFPPFTGETGISLDGIKFKPRDPSGTIEASTAHNVALDNIRWKPRAPDATHTERTGPGKISLEGIEFRPNSE